MTYLELVNQVMRRVREAQVSTVDENDYSAMVGSFINDAKAQVEDAWEWFALRTPVTMSLVAGTYTYSLSTLDDRALLMHYPECPDMALAWDVTADNPSRLFERNLEWIEDQYNISSTHPDISSPMFFAVDYTASSPSIRLYEKPAEVRDWRFIFKQPQADLADDADTLSVPWRPVVLLATNYALNEKGEEVGTPGTVAEQRYLVALNDAIAIDSRKSLNSYANFSS